MSDVQKTTNRITPERLRDHADNLSPSHFYPANVLLDAADEIARLRAERDKFERAWNDVSDRYEALLNQLGATDA